MPSEKPEAKDPPAPKPGQAGDAEPAAGQGGAEPAPAPIPEPGPAPAPDPEPEPEPAPGPAPALEPEPAPAESVDRKSVAEGLVGHPVSELYAAIGRPLASDYAPSCLVDGDDGELTYDGFTVYTTREGDQETVYAVF